MAINLAKNTYEKLRDEGYLLFQVDEATFSPRRYDEVAWAPKGEPIPKKSAWTPGKYIACIAAINEQFGLFEHLELEGRAFKTEDIFEFFQMIRAKVREDTPIGIFLDNASIHKNQLLRNLMAEAKLGITLWYNLPYRPDLNGIEHFWGEAKHKYRKTITHYVANNMAWD